MSFYYIVDILSRVGDNMDDIHNGVFADNISSFSKDICENMETQFKSVGKKHIFCVVSLKDGFKKVYRFFNNMLNAKIRGKVRVKFQYDIKEMMDSIFANSASDNASLIYTEGNNVFAAGYGEVFAYKYSKKQKKCERIDFPVVNDIQLPDDEFRKNSFSRYVGTLEAGDEYLVTDKFIYSLLGDEQLRDIFDNNRTDVCRKFSDEILKKDLSSGYSLIHLRVKKSLKSLFLWIASVACSAAVLLMLFFIV